MEKVISLSRPGHPDLMCDQIADALVDEYLRRDKQARINLRVFGSHGMLMIGGEVDSVADFDLSILAKQVYKEIGYDDDVEVFVHLEPVSEEGRAAGNVGMESVVVHGYATDETMECLPRPLVYAQELLRRLDDVRRADPSFAWMRSDGGILLTTEKGAISRLTLHVSHESTIEVADVRTRLLEKIVHPVVNNEQTIISLNTTGPFTVDGWRRRAGGNGSTRSSQGYGGLLPASSHGFSGRDPGCAERAGAYGGRAAALFLVRTGLASQAYVTLAYAGGEQTPLLVQASGLGPKTRGTKLDLTNVVKKAFDFRLPALVERFGLLKPQYQPTSAYGSFGRAGYSWEE
ncbi:methionine adenosyltransferase domain-containing protein [Candidatus Uhrbacteria bacterium]|nr:methionine adenosyltransferase domain-containing protein [Candidatus Uhrbacteria bacterium]